MGDNGMGVPQVIHRPSGHEIKVFGTISVPNAAPLATYKNHGLTPYGLGIIFLL
jgi:hypothetical protein